MWLTAVPQYGKEATTEGEMATQMFYNITMLARYHEREATGNCCCSCLLNATGYHSLIYTSCPLTERGRVVGDVCSPCNNNECNDSLERSGLLNSPNQFHQSQGLAGAFNAGVFGRRRSSVAAAFNQAQASMALAVPAASAPLKQIVSR